MSSDVVVTANSLDTAQYRGIWTPTVPQEFNDGGSDRQCDARNSAQHSDANQAADRQPEFPSLDAKDAAQVINFEQTDRGGDHDCGQRAAGYISHEVRRIH